MTFLVHKHLSKRLELSLLELAGIDEALDLLLEDGLDLGIVALAIELASNSGEILNLKLGDQKIGVVEGRLDLCRAGLALGKVVAVLGGTTHDTLVLLCSVLCSLLDLLCVDTGELVSLLLLLGETSLLLLLCGGLLGSLLGLGLLVEPLLVLLCVLLLLELLDTLVEGQAVVDQLAQADGVLGLSLLASVVVLALDVTLLVTVLVVVGNILVKVLECPPAVKVVPEVVEGLDLVASAVLVAEFGHGLGLAESAFGIEDPAPELVEALSRLLLAWGLDIGGLVDRVELATLDGVEQDLGGLLDALEEAVVLVAAGSGLLVGVVLEDLLAVCLLDLVLGSSPSVLGYAENSVVVLVLRIVSDPQPSDVASNGLFLFF